MRSQRPPKPRPKYVSASPEPPQEMPEWLEEVRLTVEREVPLKQTLIKRAINAVLEFVALSDNSVLNATSAPTNMAVLLRALSSGEILEDLSSVEPLAHAFIRGLEARRRLMDENGGTLTAEQAGAILGITRQAVEKRRRAGSLLALTTGRHGYRYPTWQFLKSGVLPGLGDVLQALAPHDEWMQATFFVSQNARLGNRTPLELLRAGQLPSVIDAAEAYGEHGAA